MKRAAVSAVWCFLATGLFGADAPVELLDIDGKVHAPLHASDRKATVFVFVSPFCPTSNTLTPEVNRIAAEYAHQFAFYLVEADSTISAGDAKKHAETLEIKTTVLLDPKQLLAKWTKAKITPEVVVLGRDGKTLYQGRINDLYTTPTKKLKEPTTHDLRAALDSIAAGKTVEIPLTKAVGCLITIVP